jgi:hypothetical protein
VQFFFFLNDIFKGNFLLPNFLGTKCKKLSKNSSKVQKDPKKTKKHVQVFFKTGKNKIFRVN